MKKEITHSRGEIIDVILRNNVYATVSVTNQNYQVGNNKMAVTVQCDKDGNVLSAHCKYGKEFIFFENPNDAKFISNACKWQSRAEKQEEYYVHKTR